MMEREGEGGSTIRGRRGGGGVEIDGKELGVGVCEGVEDCSLCFFWRRRRRYIIDLWKCESIYK